MSKKEVFIKCEVCDKDKKTREYYMSGNPKHENGCIPICKKCGLNMVDMENVESLKVFLKKVDKPYIHELYLSAMNSKRRSSELGSYFSAINMGSYKHLTWENSEGLNEGLKMQYKEAFKTKEDVELEKKLEKKSALQEELDEMEMTEEELKGYKIFWGNGYSPYEYDSFQKRYDSLIGNYANTTALHIENLKTYVVYKIKAEHLVSSDNPDPNQVKLYTDLSIKQATMARLNLDKLSAEDLSQGVDSFSEVAMLVEREIDIIPILPKFIEKPNDPIDVALLSFINYNRRMEGLEDSEHCDVYYFYQKKLKEFKEDKNTREEIKKNIIEMEITTENGKKKTVLFYDVYKVIELRKKEKPDNKFVQNLDKWMELVSYLRFFPDVFFQMMEQKDGGSIVLDSDQKLILRVFARFPFNYTVFPRGYGKCVARDTILFTSEGMKEIGDFFSVEENGKEQIVDQNINLLNKNGDMKKSNKGVYSGVKDTKTIKTEEGYEIEASLNHPLLVIDINGVLAWKKSEDLNVGDYVAISRNNDIWGNKVKLDIDMDAWFGEKSNKSKSRMKKTLKNPIYELDEEFALILGYLIGDGGLTLDGTITFSSKDDDMIEIYKHFMEDRLGVSVVHDNGDNCDYKTHCTYTRGYFEEIGLDKSDAFGKSIPRCILEAPKNIVASFVKGLFDADGGISNGYLEFCTASKKMSKQLQTILLNFGIVSTRSKKYNKQFKTYSYRICIFSSNIDVYKKHIGFSCKRKQDKLNEICKVKRNPNKDIVPYQKEVINSLFKDKRERKLHDTWLFNDFYNVRVGSNELTYERISKLKDVYEDDIGELKEFDDLNYFFSKIKTIDDTENHVYDLQVPDTNSFIGNGFVNHNTMLNIMSMYHACILYPNLTYSLTAQTRESSAKLILSKVNEIEDSYPMLKKEVKEHRSQK